MTQCTYDFAPHYRWEWLLREQWRGSFRQRKHHSPDAFVELVRERGSLNEPVLDCSSGLGLKTIVMREAGLGVHGADGCPEAIRLARLFAEEEGHADIPYFVSSWAELPRSTEVRYAAIFNDALSWVYAEDELAASLRGLHDCLLPGGSLAYMGALPGTAEDRAELLEREWEKKTSNGKHWSGISGEADGVSVHEVVFAEKGVDFIDEHHSYAVHDSAGQRVENWCLRCSLKWGWSRIEPFLQEAGFNSFDTKEFIAANGKPFSLVVATRN